MNVNIKGLEPRMKVEHKEQRVRDALSKYFSDNELNNVMSYWKKKYSKQPAFVLRRFIDEICVTEHHKSVKNQMIKDILNQFNQPVDTPDEIEVSELQECFESYLNDTLLLVPAESRDDFILGIETRLLAEAQSVDLSERADFEKATFQIISFLKADLLQRQTQNIQAALDLPLLQAASAVLYRSLCKVVGPIEADDVIRMAFEKRYAAGHTNEIHQITQL